MAAKPPNDPPENLGLGPDVPTIKMDLLGSTQTTGIASNRFDRAVRRGLATDIPDNDNRSLGVAIQTAVNQQGLFHPYITNLPLSHVRATKFGLNSAWLSFSYQRNRLTVPSQPPEKVAQWRNGSEYVQVYRGRALYDGELVDMQGGLPAGDMYGLTNQQVDENPPTLFDPTNEPEGYRFEKSIIKVIVNTYLFVNPFAQVADAIKRVNPSTFTIGGFDFGPGVLRFDGPVIDWIERFERPTRPAATVNYVFTASPYGHFHQEPFFADGSWQARNVPLFETWPGNVTFPYHV